MFSARQVKNLSRSLLKVAGQTNSTAALVSGVEQLKRLYRDDRTFRHLMVTRRVDPDIKMKALKAACGESLGPLVEELLAHLLADYSGAVLPAVIEAILWQAERESSDLHLAVTSAEALPEAQLREMGAALEGKTGSKVKVSSKVDPAVLGGVRLRLGNTLVDGTIARRLELVRQGLS